MFKKLLTGIIFLVASNGIVKAITKNSINIVAAENFYGQVAKEIGGNNVKVQSIITNPDADPHLFATSVTISKSLDRAQIIIYNGANYDSWMEQIIKSLKNKSIIIINVADLVGVKNGDNPHVWYKKETFSTLAKHLATQIVLLDKQAKNSVDLNLSKFLLDNGKVIKKIEHIKYMYHGVPVTATEPVYGYMVDAMGLKMLGLDFQWKIMNGTEPTPQILAQFEDLFVSKKVHLLFYNNQVVEPVTQNMLKLANKNKIAVVGVTETMPKNMLINTWLLNGIEQTELALKASKN